MNNKPIAGMTMKSLKHHTALQPLFIIMTGGIIFVAAYCFRYVASPCFMLRVTLDTFSAQRQDRESKSKPGESRRNKIQVNHLKLWPLIQTKLYSFIHFCHLTTKQNNLLMLSQPCTPHTASVSFKKLWSKNGLLEKIPLNRFTFPNT